LIEEGGDWDRRNRLKVYEGLYNLSVRKFKEAATLFLDTVSTFTSYELMDYSTFVVYTVYVSMLAMPRNELREKVVRGAEILEVLHNQRDVREFLMFLFDCNYEKFFRRLGELMRQLLFIFVFYYFTTFSGRDVNIFIFSFMSCNTYHTGEIGFKAIQGDHQLNIAL
jgi:26S proteasome regulatory subunit N7